MHGKLFQLLIITLLLIHVKPALAQVAAPAPYHEAAVVTADDHATQAGIKILEMGGNAVDAAIAVQFALAVTLPRAGNIGGGGFAMIRLANGKVHALDFREKAPSGATRTMFLDEDGEYNPDLSRRGALASGVPGTVDGMISALERYGTLPLEVIMEPAIRLANSGFRLTHSHAQSLNRNRENFEAFETSRKRFTRPDGTDWHEGHRFIQTELGETLQRIARQGRDGFYSGLTARMIIREQRRHGGIMTLRDLRNYESEWRTPLTATFNDHQIHMMPPPSSGGVVMQQVLDMIKHPLNEDMGVNSSGYIHLLTEAFRRSFADRNYYLGDPDFEQMPLDTLISKPYLDRRFSDFNPEHATSSDEIRRGSITGHTESDETTHFSVVDGSGNAVAVTTTLNGSYGNFMTVEGAGFLLNNEMDDFSAKPGEPNMFGLIGAEANAIEPGKRMLSSMSPTIVTQSGELRMIAGGSGGPTIISATLQNILNVIHFRMDAAQAILMPRFHHQWLPDRIVYEQHTLPDDVKHALEEKGHELHDISTLARTHILVIDEEGVRTGAADPRGHGSVRGF
ncbi:MAG: gamma-glutamyltransferase [Bacteroidota bacterium]